MRIVVPIAKCTYKQDVVGDRLYKRDPYNFDCYRILLVGWRPMYTATKLFSSSQIKDFKCAYITILWSEYNVQDSQHSLSLDCAQGTI